MSDFSKFHSQTRAIHEGVYKDDEFHSVTTPIYTTSTFYFDGVDQPPRFDYTRSGNPTRQALNENLAALEGGHAAFAVSSGMAAVQTALMILSAGDHVICGDEIYGGSHRLFTQVLPRFGITFTHVDMTDPQNIRDAIKNETKLIWIETPTNPLLNLVDLEAVVGIAKEHGLLTALDNTFLTPVLQRAMDYGIDLVVHSTTKYLNGHSDVIGGAVITRTPELTTKIGFLVNALGNGCAPFDSWLILRGIKTLVPRLEQHQKNAMAMARFLEGHDAVKRVFYPGLESHRQHALAQKQQRGFGGILSFELDVEKVDINRFFKALQLFHVCVSLGGVESLIEQPWSMSHLAMPEEAKLACGITKGIIRISAGIEHTDDLLVDMRDAFEKARI